MSITITNLSYTYAAGTPLSIAALHQVNLTIADGEFVGIMGRTGCGKSTLIQLIAGLLTPSSGQILLDGKDIQQKGYPRQELRQKVGVVFQYPEYQLFETTVARDVAFGLKHSGLDKEQIRAQVQWALEQMGFSYDRVKDLSPMGLSGGEKRRIAIAGVLAVKPKILILDEPIAGLDPTARSDFLQLLTQLNRQGVTILMVSHNADSLAEYAHRILVLEQGRIVSDEPASSLFCRPQALQAKGLGVPQARQIAQALHSRGILDSDAIYQYEPLVSALIARFQGGGRL